MIAQMLLGATRTTAAVSMYLLIATLLGAAATLCLRDRPGIALGPDNEAEQANDSTIFAPRKPARELAGKR